MAVAWPVSLQDKVNESGFSHKIGETVIRSDMDTGPRKMRRRFTRPINTFSTSIDLTTSEFSDFMTFFNTTINGGTTRFEFNHPITGELKEFRFAGPPEFRSIGGGNFTVSMEWEEMV